jgi:hypothetical protein
LGTNNYQQSDITSDLFEFMAVTKGKSTNSPALDWGEYQILQWWFTVDNAVLTEHYTSLFLESSCKQEIRNDGLTGTYVGTLHAVQYRRLRTNLLTQ